MVYLNFSSLRFYNCQLAHSMLRRFSCTFPSYYDRRTMSNRTDAISVSSIHCSSILYNICHWSLSSPCRKTRSVLNETNNRREWNRGNNEPLCDRRLHKRYRARDKLFFVILQLCICSLMHRTRCAFLRVTLIYCRVVC